ncbi:3-hydroxyacyl-CoA dehydrogenase family protein [Neobacillus sp. OS1-32]|uniref:3-hydroxyacyl-CoA dehydrogenase family protein n=1 Tax=Neobacillus sp. OS1-32 TaxID=3070682 RepID=UPI0027E1CDAF|nr:3-hydroxyacyl-CoA dehydrogenase family protein [Neobacillus sp. OS1-32]WML31260.1 3-hydroxyacyl-CoA dehydrogenase family protein [Neobacillus sp. OS1-32]
MGVEKVKQITVVGAGVMGSQIAMVSALAGYRTILQDVSEENLKQALNNLNQQMERRVKKGRLSEEAVAIAFENLSITTSLGLAVEETDFVIEAIVEKLEAKRQLFTEMDQLAPPQAIFTTNSSTIVSSKLADATNRPERVCNMHFSNPALVMELVEVVKNPLTSDETAQMTINLAKSFNKVPILLKKEISGFVMNRILDKIMKEAIELYENGVASFEDIDLACTKGLNHPIGPFALIDLTGLDVHYNVRQFRYLETGDESSKPSKTVVEKLKKGELGRKSGKGFYTYS